jgi:hypothetical protein
MGVVPGHWLGSSERHIAPAPLEAWHVKSVRAAVHAVRDWPASSEFRPAGIVQAGRMESSAAFPLIESPQAAINAAHTSKLSLTSRIPSLYAST